MRWLCFVSVLMLVSGLAFAQRVAHYGKEPRLLYRAVISDPTVTSGDRRGPGRNGSNSVFASTNGRARNYVYPGWVMTITHEDMALSEAHTGATQHCLVTLEYSADGTGTDGVLITGSGMETNLTTFDCDGETKDLDGQGDRCRQRIGPITLIGPAWIQWKFVDGSSNTCGSIDVQLSVHGSEKRG